VADIVVSLTKKGREMEAQSLLYGYGFRIDFFVVGSGGHDPGNPTLALPLDTDVVDLPGQFFGPEPIDEKVLVTSTCPRWTCILQPGEAVGQISNFGLTATVVYVPASSLLLNPDVFTPGTSNKDFSPSDVSTGADLITITGHGFSDGEQVVFSSSNILPTGLSNTVEYFVVGSTINNFQVSLTNGGLPVDITTAGVGTHTVRLASDDLIIVPGHGLITGNTVNFITTDTLPSGIISGQSYFVINATPSTFKISQTLNGPPLDFFSQGTGVHTLTNLSSLPSGAPEVGSTFLYAITNFPARSKLASMRETYTVTLQT